ncbi:hypothetical protein BVX93_01445, partial [bacterium B13(2017)]
DNGSAGKLWSLLLKEKNINLMGPFFKNQQTRMNFHPNASKEIRLDVQAPIFNESQYKQMMDEIKKIIETKKNIILSGTLPDSLPSTFYREIAEFAEKNDSKVFVDSKGLPLKEVIKANSFLIKANLKEFADLAKIHPDKLVGNQNLIIKEAKKVIEENNINSLIVSLGGEGAFYIDKEKVFKAVPPEVFFKSEIGCGDSLLAGFFLEYQKSQNIENALKYAVACGTATALHESTELGTLEEIEELIPRINVISMSPFEIDLDNSMILQNYPSLPYLQFYYSFMSQINDGATPVWVTDLDDTLTRSSGVRVSKLMARSIINYLQQGGLFTIMTGSKLGETSSWNDKNNKDIGVINQFLKPIYSELLEMNISNHEIKQLFQQVIFCTNSGSEINVIETIQNEKLVFQSLYEAPKLDELPTFGEQGKAKLMQLIDTILGNNSPIGLLGHLMFEEKIKEIGIDDIGHLISWELDLLEIMILHGSKEDWEGFQKDDWFSLIKTLKTEEQIQCDFEDTIYLEDILQSEDLGFDVLEEKIKLLNEKLIKKWQEKYESDIIIDLKTQIKVITLGIKYTPYIIKRAYKRLNAKRVNRGFASTPVLIANLFNQMYMAKEGIIARPAGSSTVDISRNDKAFGIRILKELCHFLNNRGSKVPQGFISDLESYRHLLSQKWASNSLLVAFSGDALDTLQGNDVPGVKESNLVIMADSTKRIAQDLITTNANTFFIESVIKDQFNEPFIYLHLPFLTQLFGEIYSNIFKQKTIQEIYDEAA